MGTDCLPGAPFETSTSILYHCHVHDFCSSRILIRKVSASEWQVEAIDPSSGVQSPPQVKQELREEKSPSPRPARPIQTSAGSDNEPDDADHDFVFHPEPELAEERIPQPKKRQGPHHNNTQPPSYRPCPPITSEEAEEVQQTPQTDSLYSSRVSFVFRKIVGPDS